MQTPLLLAEHGAQARDNRRDQTVVLRGLLALPFGLLVWAVNVHTQHHYSTQGSLVYAV